MTTNAIRRGSRFVTSGAGKEISPRRPTMKIARSRIASDPTRRVRIASSSHISAHSLLNVAGIAVGWGVAAHALSWLGARFERVPHHEISPVHHVVFESVGALLLHRERLTQVVAGLAIRLRVTTLAECFLRLGGAAVLPEEESIMSQEGHRQSFFQIGP